MTLTCSRVRPDGTPGDADGSAADGRTWYQRTGEAWLESAKALVLLAPSLVVPKEWNAMLNPAHPRMVQVAIISSELFRLDRRLSRGLDGAAGIAHVRDRSSGAVSPVATAKAGAHIVR